MSTYFEIAASGSSGSLMFVKDFNASGTKRTDSIHEMINICRTAKSAWIYDDDSVWRRRAIKRFFVTEWHESGYVAGRFEMDTNGNEVRQF